MSTEPLAVERITADPDWYEPYRISLAMRLGNLGAGSGSVVVEHN